MAAMWPTQHSSHPEGETIKTDVNLRLAPRSYPEHNVHVKVTAIRYAYTCKGRRMYQRRFVGDSVFLSGVDSRACASEAELVRAPWVADGQSHGAIPTGPSATPQASHWLELGPSTILMRRRQPWALLELMAEASAKPRKQRRLINHRAQDYSVRETSSYIQFSVNAARKQVLKQSKRASERAPGSNVPAMVAVSLL